ncbi:MAG TPA: XRE family transcriptional regulator [Nocardioidaceae bacterium]|jgi:transcriptional regulator with XRE-family HTH domain|nr:XRE family transcriptional regulator [Nocardioidaceae bacterium]
MPADDPVTGGDMFRAMAAVPGDSAGEGSAPPELERALGAVMAQRVREYRKMMGLSVAQLAARSGLSKGMLSKLENAQASPSLATLARLSGALGVPVTAFFRGLDEERDVLFVKAGQGLDISHRGSRAGHRYQNLGSMRGPHKRMEPVLVTLVERSEVFPLYQHAGTELLYVITGTMEYTYGDATYTLEPGDALQFSGETTHGPRRLISVPVQFLSVKAYGSPPPE